MSPSPSAATNQRERGLLHRNAGRGPLGGQPEARLGLDRRRAAAGLALSAVTYYVADRCAGHWADTGPDAPLLVRAAHKAGKAGWFTRAADAGALLDQAWHKGWVALSPSSWPVPRDPHNQLRQRQAVSEHADDLPHLRGQTVPARRADQSGGASDVVGRSLLCSPLRRHALNGLKEALDEDQRTLAGVVGPVRSAV